MNYLTKFISWVVVAIVFACSYSTSAFAAGPACSLIVTALPVPQAQTVTVGTTNFDFTHIKLSAPTNCNITVNKIVVGINNGSPSMIPVMVSNLKVFKDVTSVQIGNTITTPDTSNIIGPNLGLSLPAGTSVVIALKADVIGVGSGHIKMGIKGVHAIKTGTNIQVGNNNAYWGKQMTLTQPIPVGNFTYIRMDAATGDLPIDANTPNTLIGTFQMRNQSNESININSIGIGAGNTTVAISNLTNLKVRVYNSTPGSFTEYTMSNFSLFNNFSVNKALAPGENSIVDVLVDIGNASSGEITQVTLGASGIGLTSGLTYPIIPPNTGVSAVLGQTMTVN